MSNYRVAVFSRRRRKTLVAPADPLGAGNTALIAALTTAGFTPLGFYETRKGMTVSGGTDTGHVDVRGSSGFGPALVGTGHAPTYDAVNDWVTNASSSVYLVSSKVSAFDRSGSISLCHVMSVPDTARNYVVGLSTGSPTTQLAVIPNTASPAKIQLLGDGASDKGSSSVSCGDTIRCLLIAIRADGTTWWSVASATGNPGNSVVTSGNEQLSIFSEVGTAGSSNTGARWRASIVLPGDITGGSDSPATTAMSLLTTWAATYRGATLA